jgi:hypothetical protein
VVVTAPVTLNLDSLATFGKLPKKLPGSHSSIGQLPEALLESVLDLADRLDTRTSDWNTAEPLVWQRRARYLLDLLEFVAQMVAFVHTLCADEGIALHAVKAELPTCSKMTQRCPKTSLQCLDDQDILWTTCPTAS